MNIQKHLVSFSTPWQEPKDISPLAQSDIIASLPMTIQSAMMHTIKPDTNPCSHHDYENMDKCNSRIAKSPGKKENSMFNVPRDFLEECSNLLPGVLEERKVGLL